MTKTRTLVTSGLLILTACDKEALKQKDAQITELQQKIKDLKCQVDFNGKIDTFSPGEVFKISPQIATVDRVYRMVYSGEHDKLERNQLALRGLKLQVIGKVAEVEHVKLDAPGGGTRLDLRGEVEGANVLCFLNKMQPVDSLKGQTIKVQGVVEDGLLGVWLNPCEILP